MYSTVDSVDLVEAEGDDPQQWSQRSFESPEVFGYLCIALLSPMSIAVFLIPSVDEPRACLLPFALSAPLVPVFHAVDLAAFLAVTSRLPLQ